MASFFKREIWLSDMPGGVGHEQKGRRPVVIISAIPSVDMVVMVPLTSNTGTARFPFTLKILPCKENGLSVESVALVFQLASVDCCRMIEKMGELFEEDQERIDNAITELLFC